MIEELKNPVKYYEQNIIFNDKRDEAWAVYKLKGENYEHLSNTKKINLLNRITRFLGNIGSEAKIMMIPKNSNIDEVLDKYLSTRNKKDRYYPAMVGFTEETKDYLGRKQHLMSMGGCTVYLAVKLKLSNKIMDKLKEALEYLFKEPFRTLEEILGSNDFEVFESEIDRFIAISNDYLSSQQKRIKIEPVDETEIQWLIRRMTFRGLKEPNLRYNLKHNGGKKKDYRFFKESHKKEPWQPYAYKYEKNGKIIVRPHQKDILNLVEGEIDVSEPGVVKCHHSKDEISYQSFVSLTGLPDDLAFPGNEYLMKVQEMGLNVEVIIHLEVPEYRESLKTVTTQKRNIQGQIDHIRDSDDEVPDDLLAKKEQAEQLRLELKNARSSILKASITFCLFSKDEKDLENQVKFLIETFEDIECMIERPRTDQLRLFYEAIPGAGRYLTDYTMILPPDNLAGSMFLATKELGDDCGPYIGYTGATKKPVYFDFSRASRENRAPSAAFLGTLGGGKSFNANLVGYMSTLYGGQSLYVDPKGDRDKWIKELKEFTGDIALVNFGPGDEDAGRLDPFIVYKHDQNKAEYLAETILTELFKLQPDDEKTIVLQETLTKSREYNNRSMQLITDMLIRYKDQEFPELERHARMLGKMVLNLKTKPMASLLFHDGEKELDPIDFNKKINILQIRDLNMPSPTKDPKDYTMEERLSTVLMLPLESFVRTFIHRNNKQFGVVVIDEAWSLTLSESGRRMIEEIIRLGRSLYTGCILIGHSVEDMRFKGIKENITYKFIFKATDDEEIGRILDFVELEDTSNNREMISKLPNGTCLFKDLDDRIGILKFEAVFQHIIDAFDTTPVEEIQEGEEDEYFEEDGAENDETA